MKKLVVFDFDKTLFFTPEPDEGKKVFKLNTGLDWMYSGWWGRRETLNVDIFHIPINQYVYNSYNIHMSESNTKMVLATGRLEKMRREVQRILDMNNLSFDKVYLNPGIDTFVFKSSLFEELIKVETPDRLVMYDDRQEHLFKFEAWATKQKCIIEINDVVNKKIKIFND